MALLSYNWFTRITYWLIIPFLFISYLLEPLTEDAMIYLGTAKVAALTPGFPMTLDTVWEDRFVGHRFLYYLLNWLASPFHGETYAICVKLIVGVVIVAVLYYFSKTVSGKMAVPFNWVFILGYLGLFAVHSVIMLSAELVSVVIAMMMMAMILGDNRYLQFASGLLILPLLILKGLPVLLVGIVMLAVMMLAPSDYPDRFKRAAVALPLVGAALILLIVTFPHFISDIFLVVKMAHISGRPDWVRNVTVFGEYLVGQIGMVPIIIAGLCAGLLTLPLVIPERSDDRTVIEIKRSRMVIVTLLGLMWLVAAPYVFIISEFYYMHYYLMLIPAILTSCYFLKIHPPTNRPFMILTVVTTTLLFVTIIAGWSPGMGSIQYQMAADRQADVDTLNSQMDILSQPTTLYLDDGVVSYFFPTRSECRYVGALPYERDTTWWDMKGVPEYWEDRNCSLGYTGKYIIVNPRWFTLGESTHAEMATKLADQYILVHSFAGNETERAGIKWRWDIYQRRVGI